MYIEQSVIAFAGSDKIASGKLASVASKVKRCIDAGDSRNILILDMITSKILEIDFRGTEHEVLSRLQSQAPTLAEPQRKPGRPKLGVIGREVTLLPRHWEWLNTQPGGASVALRKLVEQARRFNEPKDQLLRSQEATFKFISALAGNEVGFEEAVRALFANDELGFSRHTKTWPADIHRHAASLFKRQLV